MPFGLRFKRTRRYEVSSKNAFVVGVHMLDNSFLECTLTSDSTGQECLDSIAQRIELTETQYFGLRYVTKKLQFHWVDLDRPLKKQIDKYAQASASPRLYFGVVFYIPGAHRITDDAARYQYFLQLKTDIVDGRIPINVEQVVRLASLCLQAEFGDHEYDKNAQDYFKDNALFPKTMCKDENVVAEMINETLSGFIRLQGIQPLMAEMQYIKEIQMMDGYGMEYYTAKDEKGKELYLGTSYLGIFARYLDGQPAVFFRWSEIARLTQSKKSLEIDTSKSSCQYLMEDSETAKYLRRMGTLQQKFYKANKCSPSSSIVDLSEYLDTESIVSPDLQQISQSEFPDQLTQSQTSLTYSQHSQQSQDTRFEQEFSQSSASADEYYRQSQQSLETTGSYEYQQQQQQQHQQQMYPEGGVIVNGRMYSPLMQHHQLQPPQTPPQHHVDPRDPNYASRVAALPAYRPSPSYDEVMRHRLSQQPQQVQGHTPHTIANSQIYQQTGENMAYSHPEVSQYNVENDYVNSSTIRNYNNNTMYANVFQDEKNNYLQYRANERTSNLIMQPTYSSPELTTQGAPQYTQYSSDNMLGEPLPFQYKPPPPYPRASSSTPDLAAQTNKNTNVSDSPDLVSRKSLGLSAPGLQAGLDKSLENLAVEGPNEEGAIVMEAHEDLVTGVTPPQISISNAEQIDSASQIDHDDASSDQSGATFHAKDTDSEVEDGDRTLKREGSKTQAQIQIKYVAPSKAPPPSTSKEVVTRRESFRRMMIARTGQMNPSALVGSEESAGASGGASNATVVKPENSVIPEQTSVENDSSKSGDQTKLENRSSFQLKLERRPSSQAKLEKKNSLQGKLERNSSIQSHSSSASGQESFGAGDMGGNVQGEGFAGLNFVPPVGNYMKEETVNKIKELSAHEAYDEDDEHFSDSDDETDGKKKKRIGPLKMAALNGLTLSRPMVLALMNDESRAPKDERRKLLETKISENRVVKEFEEIPKKVQAMENQVAKLQENESRNRFRDILPYDATRVKITPRKDNSAGYINASHVKLSVGERVWWYIATQAPIENTAVDFWQMVWEQEIDVIAMLTAVVELGRKKCFQYWPQEIGPQHKITFGQFEITLMFCNDSLCYVTNRISVVHLPSKKERQVWHLQYTDWPDHGCPDDMYGFLGFLDEVESVQRLAESEEGSGKKSPILVHCSAGVGRTGVVILTQVMKWCLEHNHDIDLQKALAAIRQQRMYMVQTLGQYNFIHKTLIQYLKNTRLI